MIYQSFALYFPDEDIALAVQQNDIRINGFINLVNVFSVLLNTYLDYDPYTGTQEQIADLPVTLFPNPANNVINISLPQQTNKNLPVKCEIYTLAGQQVKSIEVNNSVTTVTIDDLLPGAYFLRFNDRQSKVLFLRFYHIFNGRLYQITILKNWLMLQ